MYLQFKSNKISFVVVCFFGFFPKEQCFLAVKHIHDKVLPTEQYIKLHHCQSSAAGGDEGTIRNNWLVIAPAAP